MRTRTSAPLFDFIPIRPSLPPAGDAAPVLYNVVLMVKDGPYADGKFTLVQTKVGRSSIVDSSHIPIRHRHAPASTRPASHGD